jgi:hypothetical protein
MRDFPLGMEGPMTGNQILKGKVTHITTGTGFIGEH